LGVSVSTKYHWSAMNKTFIGKGKQILLVDDDPNLVLLLQDYLQFHRYEVLTATDGQTGLAILQQETPDLIICDAIMPEMDGYTFVKRVKNHPQTDRIPVMMLSARGLRQEKLKGLNAGADVYVVKPFGLEELIAQIESCLRKAVWQGNGTNPPIELHSQLAVG